MLRRKLTRPSFNGLLSLPYANSDASLMKSAFPWRSAEVRATDVRRETANLDWQVFLVISLLVQDVFRLVHRLENPWLAILITLPYQQSCASDTRLADSRMRLNTISGSKERCKAKDKAIETAETAFPERRGGVGDGWCRRLQA